MSITYFLGAEAQVVYHHLEKELRNHADMQLGYKHKDGEGLEKSRLSNVRTKGVKYWAMIAECRLMNFSDIKFINAFARPTSCQVVSNFKCLFKPFKYSNSISCVNEILKRNIMTAWTNRWNIKYMS